MLPRPEPTALRDQVRCLLAAGVVFLAVAPVSAQNQLSNPDFNHGVAGWESPSGTLAWLASDDLDSCPGSGVASVSGPEISGAERWLELTGSCADVSPDEVVHYHVRLFPVVPAAANDFLLLTYTDDECAVGEVEALLVGYNAFPSIWMNLMIGTTIQASVQSVRILVRSRDPALATLESRFDRIYFGPGSPVFLDDFEAGSFCRWSFVQT